jgi:drug/metabolite transporter (DMT)-like permease
LVVAAFAAVYFIWGSTYLGIAFAIETIPPFTMAGLRFLIAGSILFGWARLKSEPRPTRLHWRTALIVGTLLLGANGLLSWAEQFVPSGIAALIVATVPMWMVIVDAIRPGGARPGWSIVAGLAMGLFGIIILIGPSSLGSEPVDRIGALTILVASISWAIGSVYSKHAPATTSTLQNVGMQMLAGGTLLVAAGFLMGERLIIDAVSARSFWSLMYLATAGGVVSYGAYLWLLRVTTPVRVATYAYVNPVIAVFLGWALASEPLNQRVALAAVAVVSAVVLITTARTRSAQKLR